MQRGESDDEGDEGDDWEDCDSDDDKAKLKKAVKKQAEQ